MAWLSFYFELVKWIEYKLSDIRIIYYKATLQICKLLFQIIEI